MYIWKNKNFFHFSETQVDASYRSISDIRHCTRVVSAARTVGQNCSFGRFTWASGLAVRLWCGWNWKGKWTEFRKKCRGKRILYLVIAFWSNGRQREAPGETLHAGNTMYNRYMLIKIVEKNRCDAPGALQCWPMLQSIPIGDVTERK